MKIVTYNVNGIKARLPRLLEYLEEQQPDVVCLQELKAPDEAFPHEEISRLGYAALWHGQKSFNGVAILARGEAPLLRRMGLPGEDEFGHSRYIEAEVGGMVVASLYLPNGNPRPGPKYDYKLAWMRRLQSHAAELLKEERPVVLAGDYNVVPTDADVFSAKGVEDDALLHPDTRAHYRTLLAQGWTESMRALHPDGRIFTFWDYQMGAWARDAGFRIDFLLCSPPAADRLIAAAVDKEYRGREKASDHAPTWARFSD